MDLAKVIHCLKLLSRCKVHYYRAFDDVKLLTPGYQIPPNPGAVLILNGLHESFVFQTYANKKRAIHQTVVFWMEL